VDDAARIREIEKAFAAENVVIAEVGAWVNMLDPDADKRAKNLHYVSERLALAEAVGARCCPTLPVPTIQRSGTGRIPRTFRRNSSMPRWKTAAT